MYPFTIYFNVKKNVFESTDGPYPQLSVQRWVWERVQWSLLTEQGGEEQVERKQQAWGVEQAGDMRAGRGTCKRPARKKRK